MKKISIGLISFIILTIGAVHLFVQGTQSSNQSVNSTCQSYEKGQKIDLEKEIALLEKQGFHVSRETSVEASPTEQSLIITAPGLEPASCRIQVQDGTVLQIQ